jgi:hypothetical protein
MKLDVTAWASKIYDFGWFIFSQFDMRLFHVSLPRLKDQHDQYHSQAARFGVEDYRLGSRHGIPGFQRELVRDSVMCYFKTTFK